MKRSEPTAPIHDADRPPFHKLDSARFEQLLVDLLQEEDGIVLAEQHGVSGQADFGVDAIGWHQDGTCDLISCKRYTEITPGQLVGWSDEMLKHWAGRWSRHRIRRFILATSATDLGRMQIIDRVSGEFERFGALGIRYELWGPTKLRAKLVPHRRLAAAYMKEHWADAICGPAVQPTARISPGPSMIQAGVLAQMAELQNMLSGEIAGRVEAALELLRQGRLDAVRTLADEMQREPRWGQLVPAVQAKVLRLEGSVALIDGDIRGATRRNDQADALHVPDEPRLAARIAAESGNAEDGLVALGSPHTVPGRQLRCAMLLATGRRDEAREELLLLDLDHPDEPETLRLLALERLGSGFREDAFDLIRRVEAIAGNWLATRRAGGIIRYALALSPCLGADWTLVPNPIDSDLVRRDAEAAALLGTAIELIDGIPVDLRSADDELWRLAILANIEGRRTDAVKLAGALLASAPADAMVVAWVLMRGLEVGLGPSRSALEEAYRAGTDVPRIRVLGMLLASGGSHDEAARLLEDFLGMQDGEAHAEAQLWIARFRGTGMDRNSKALFEAQRNGDWAPAETLLCELLSADPPHPFGLTIAELAASANRWNVLAQNVDRLVAYRSANGVRIAVMAAMNASRFKQALGLLDEHASTFGRELPADMRRLKAEALARAGQFRTAIGEAAVLAAHGRLDDALFEAELRARVGSVRQASSVVKRALSEGVLGSMTALKWSQRLRRTDPALAKDLVRAAISAGVDDEYVFAAWNEAVGLGLEAETSLLMPRIAAKAASGDPGIVSVSADRAHELIGELLADEDRARELYMSGAIPIHLYARGRPDVLLRAHWLNTAPEDGTARALQPRLVRHGARPLDQGIGSPYEMWHVHLDVTGLLEAHRAGLLDRLEAHPHGITVSGRLPIILQQMQLAMEGDADRSGAFDRLMRLTENCSIDVVEWAPPDVTRIRMENEEGPGRPLRDFIGAVTRLGLLRDDEVAGFGDVAVDHDGPEIALTSMIVASGRALTLLASSGLLERIAEHVPLAVEAATIERLRAAALENRTEIAMAASVSALAQRVGDGIAAGTYHVLPTPSVDHDGDEDAGRSHLDEELIELLSLPPSERLVVWIDDRSLTGYVTAGTVPIVGMLEVVSAMETSGFMTPHERADVQKAFRASGAAFVPFATEECMEPLLAAPIVDGRLIETDELRDLRRAFATTRTLEPHLKIGSSDELLKDRPDEDFVARSLMRVLSETLHQLWAGGRLPIPECLARSDWLLDALRIHRLFRVPTLVDSDDNRLLFEVMQIGHCIDKAWEIGGSRDEHRDHRLDYLSWCWQRLIVPRMGTRPSVVKATGEYLARFYASIIKEGVTDGRISRTIHERLMFLRVQRLPDPIAEHVRAAGIFPHHVRYSTVVTLGSHRVVAERFWRAMRETARYGRSVARTVHGRRILLRRTDEGVAISGAVKVGVAIDVALVLAALPGDAAAATARHLTGLDLAPDDFARFAEDGSRRQNLADAASALQKADAASVVACRRLVEQSLERRRGANLVDLEPPLPTRMAWHHRIDVDGDPSGVSAWHDLSRSIGVVDAFVRLAALPSAVEAAETVTMDELEGVVAAARTPMALASAGRLLRERNATTTDVLAVVQRFVEAVERWGELYAVVLRWTLATTKLDPTWNAVEARTRLRLCWLHADWLIRVFDRHHFDPTPLMGSFPMKEERMGSLDRLALTPSGPADQADPSTISGGVLMMHGLAAILGDQDASALLPDDLMMRIRRAILKDDAGQVIDVRLLLRQGRQDDALGGFLVAMPRGILDDAGLLVRRDELVDLAMARLERDGSDREAWLGLAGLSKRGLDPDRTLRLIALVDSIDLFQAADLQGADPQAFIWRGVLGPIAWGGHRIDDRLAALSARCARTFAGSVRTDTRAELAFNELVETALNAARTSYIALDHGQACRHLWIIATNWPASAPLMRRLVGRVLDGAAPTGDESFWRLGNDLNRIA